MANEITAYGSLQVVNGYLSVLEDSGTLSITQSAKEAFTSTVACTTSDTAISISGVTAPKWCYMRNVGANPIKVGATSGGAIIAMIQLAAGEFAIMPLVPSVALRQQTTTSTSTLKLTVFGT